MTSQIRRVLLLQLLLLVGTSLGRSNSLWSSAFVVPSFSSSSQQKQQQHRTFSFPLFASVPDKKETQKKKQKTLTMRELQEQIKQKPASFETAANNGKSKGKYKRQRKRVDNPQQQYLYAAQRKALEQQQHREEALLQKMSSDDHGEDNSEDSKANVVEISSEQQQQQQEPVPLALAKEYGLVNPAAQHCDALVDDAAKPKLLGQIRVGDDMTSGSYVYIVEKPAGWAILGGDKKRDDSNKEEEQSSDDSSGKTVTKKDSKTTRLVEIQDRNSGSKKKDILEYSESDLLTVMTPEEIEEYKAEMKHSGGEGVQKLVIDDADNDAEDDLDWEELDLNDDELALLNDESFEMNVMEMLAIMTPEELADYEREVGPLPEEFQQQHKQATSSTISLVEDTPPATATTTDGPEPENEETLDPKTAEVLSKIEARKAAAKSGRASFEPASRPSVVAWLKELKAQEGTPIRGGNFWTGLAGATSVDDSGIVILCPKTQVDNVFVDYLEYVAVVGNAKYLAPKPKGVESLRKEEMTMEIASKVRRGRGNDSLQTVKVMVPETFSSCSSIVQACQQQFADGIRGDPAGNPLGRLGNRRLIHCNAVSVSSLTFDSQAQAETEAVPDDIAILAERRNHKYKQGSFLGRSALKENPLTNAYREINGASDGFPGWTVDRYDKWLFVQHDENFPRGPLPSIHDGNTAGVYILNQKQDRSAMGSVDGVRPQLLEGQAAPDIMPILENGITYHVSLDKDLSTGIFLDQRPQRAWLARNCNEDTHVLNCFAHCGGFSIAAATAGASTTSIDLSKKWLDRVQPQLEANGVEFDIRHDCIYGDCFDWLAKLAKRGEKYDIVILDPPSTSVGGKKKKRWSIKNDMPDLVALAAQTVKPGGLLWTTTNSATISPTKFARLCRKGLEEAGLNSAKLERIQPMPHDFPSVGPQPVKNYVWRLP